jgi:hypothetical protein
VIEESEHLLALRRRFPPAAVAMGSSDMNEVVRVTPDKQRRGRKDV